MSLQKEPVTVRILDREFRVMCSEDERRTLVESALALDEQMRAIRDSGKVTSIEKIAVMCALNLAAENRQLKDERASYAENIDQRIAQLAASLDQAG
ncbi:MAG: cell division protein ZapA [Wenzhouxiangella sp.]|nr:cell division protein ZapA [Wenzhouxiangella sp.]MDR9453663.1 cell division protein ZapA [Wenzhouxiangella sp.]